MPLKLRRKVGEAFDVDDVLRISVDDANKRERKIDLLAIPLEDGRETEDFQLYRIPLGETITIGDVQVKPFHITAGGTVYLYLTAPQEVRLYRTELLQRNTQ